MRILPILLVIFSCTAWAGQWETTLSGCKLWNPAPVNGETVSWSGDCENGYASGYGVEQWFTYNVPGNKLIGTMKQGRFESGKYIEIYLPKDEDYLAKTYFGIYSGVKREGYGVEFFSNGDIYQGQFSNNRRSGKGVLTYANGRKIEGIWANGVFQNSEQVNLNRLIPNSVSGEKIFDIDFLRNKLERDEPRSIESAVKPEEKRQREQAKASHRINLKISVTPPTKDGEYTIFIETNADTASLKINGEEQGGNADGRYKINRLARAGQETKLDILAKDVYGNSDTKTITVSRPVVESKSAYAPLNPSQIKRKPERDAVAIIIGISNYKTLPKAEFADEDARVFYDYAIRALGVKPENIKLLVDSDAEDVEIIKAFKTWLPSRVKSTTDVYVYYSGHGLPTQDGRGLYLLPSRADRDLISRTSIQFQDLNADLQAAAPKSVTIFMDSCYSGQARGGETLVANARPIAVKSEKMIFPDHFTVFTASQADQMSSSNPELKHGIFSYYLMKGMEGDADTNKDGKITLGEMHAYLAENVGRQAGMMSRKQDPQLIGDASKVLVGR